MEISHFVLLSVLCVRQAKTHLSHQAAQNEKNMFIYIANFEFSFCICICYWYFFLPFSFHCDWRRRRWWHRHHHGCRLRSKMTHGSLVARSIVSESQLDKHVTKHNFPFFHLSSSQSHQKWFQSWWQMIPWRLWKIADQVEYEKSGKDQNLSICCQLPSSTLFQKFWILMYLFPTYYVHWKFTLNFSGMYI